MCFYGCKLGVCIVCFPTTKGESGGPLSEGPLQLLFLVMDSFLIATGGVKVKLKSLEVALHGLCLLVESNHPH